MVTSKTKHFIWIGVLLLAAALLYYLFNPSGQLFFPKCPFHEHLGIYCAGCGSQRAIHDLLHLRIGEAISHNLLLLPALLFILLEGFYRIVWPQKESPFYHKWTPWIVLILIIGFMILRNLKGWPFEYLAP